MKHFFTLFTYILHLAISRVNQKGNGQMSATFEKKENTTWDVHNTFTIIIQFNRVNEILTHLNGHGLRVLQKKLSAWKTNV